MPKKKKAGKNTKSKGIVLEKRTLLEPSLDGQVFGVLEKALGSRFFDVKCLDSVMRRCKVRKKRLKVQQGDVVIVSLRDFDDKNADIIHRYHAEEVRELQKNGSLPSSIIISKNDAFMEDDDCAFDFDDI